jgi:hypothetical protein
VLAHALNMVMDQGYEPAPPPTAADPGAALNQGPPPEMRRAPGDEDCNLSPEMREIRDNLRAAIAEKRARAQDETYDDWRDPMLTRRPRVQQL